MKKKALYSSWLVFMLIASLALTACIRPAPDSEAPPTDGTGDDAAVPVVPANPGSNPLDPAGQPLDPAGQPLDPAGQPLDPAGQPLDPSGQPIDPAAPVTDPAAPVTDPAAPVTDPAAPVTDPAAPATDPAAPVTDPAAPVTDPGTLPVTTPSTYTVVAGDNLVQIAARFGVSVSDLAAANNLTNIHRLSVGQVLTIPAAGTTPADPVAPPVVEQTHVIQWGETLFSIAIRYGITTGDLAAYNGISDINDITAGELLRIPTTP